MGLAGAALCIWAAWKAFELFRELPDQSMYQAPWMFLLVAFLGGFMTYQCVMTIVALP
jgi:hypothetical protein